MPFSLKTSSPTTSSCSTWSRLLSQCSPSVSRLPLVVLNPDGNQSLEGDVCTKRDTIFILLCSLTQRINNTTKMTQTLRAPWRRGSLTNSTQYHSRRSKHVMYRTHDRSLAWFHTCTRAARMAKCRTPQLTREVVFLSNRNYDRTVQPICRSGIGQRVIYNDSTLANYAALCTPVALLPHPLSTRPPGHCKKHTI